MATEGPTCMGPGPGPGPLRIRASIKQAGLGSTGTIPSRGPGPLALGEPRSHSVPQARVTVPTEWPSLTVGSSVCTHIPQLIVISPFKRTAAYANARSSFPALPVHRAHAYSASADGSVPCP